MSKLPIIDSRKLLRILLRMGFLEVRSKGSHLQLKKGNLLVTVPMHKKDIKPETLKSILRQAKINLEDLENYL
jgi:predicted RNA binding protein YcfA (HicA-like mRNA interferase family)